MAQRFTSRYRGKRYSFGYLACHNLGDQAGHAKLLKLSHKKSGCNSLMDS